MDRVRFGRALGFGARQAAKALWKAGEAAMAPAPASTRSAATPSAAVGKAQVAGQQVRATHAGLKRGGKRFGEAFWGPLAKASGVLWLEFTGVFFGLFALTAAGGMWKLRHSYAQAGAPRQHFLFALGMFLLFGWFTASSFFRARRRNRR